MRRVSTEATRMILSGRAKALLLETCGPTCVMFDGRLCEDCAGERRVVDEKTLEQQSTEEDFD